MFQCCWNAVGAPWHEVNKELCDTLAKEYLPRQMSQKQRASILARILGEIYGFYLITSSQLYLRVGHVIQTTLVSQVNVYGLISSLTMLAKNHQLLITPYTTSVRIMM